MFRTRTARGAADRAQFIQVIKGICALWRARRNSTNWCANRSALLPSKNIWLVQVDVQRRMTTKPVRGRSMLAVMMLGPRLPELGLPHLATATAFMRNSSAERN